ncbi:hypothetical protein PVAND_000411 [Polypedilum vanderplanki]|uniref:Zinc finger protein 830 n=1 Tax=Polypedilum vanderplanki TaxID=319348 RepID=A0A9J6BJR6_POLVA|nr:hypothetical protein PVAND_000411 [Polypedilum vanderplanki]
MNAAFRLEKKKVSQSELRRLMNEQKQSRNAEIKKIDSPFAKYENGQLHCVLCKSIVRSEAVWNVHINASQHKENLAIAKELKSKLQNKQSQKDEDRVAGMKRSIEEMRSEVPEKKIKGILKNSTSSSVVTNITKIIVPKQTDVSQNVEQDQPPTKSNSIPDDFFDSKNKKSNEEEWAKFQKEIKDAEAESKVIINEDFEEATAERQIDEIDEQIRNWSRVLEMEKKKELIETKLKVMKTQETKIDIVMKSSDSENDDDDDDEIPEFIDWRAKKSHK